jgi:hypothetical protein
VPPFGNRTFNQWRYYCRASPCRRQPIDSVVAKKSEREEKHMIEPAKFTRSESRLRLDHGALGNYAEQVVRWIGNEKCPLRQVIRVN